MLDLKLLRTKTEDVKKALRKKRVDPVKIDNILVLDAEKRKLLVEVEELQAKRNNVSKKIPQLKSGEKGGEKEILLKEMQFVKAELGELEPKLEKIENELNALLVELPNPPLESVPAGNDERDNKIIRTVGKPPKFSFEPRDHVAIGRDLDLFEFEAAAQASGARFYYLKNDAVLWEFALVQFVLAKLVKKGFTPVVPPVLVKEHAMYATGFFPAERNEIYHVNPEDDDLYLAGTSEVPLCMLHAGKTLPAEELPKRYIGFSTCFRREAGTYGKDTHGIIRVHQFDKMEMFSFCDPENSEKEHETLLAIEEEILQELGFYYQVVNICGGDLGAPAAKKYDIEVWIPSQKTFRELTSCSNCTDFQARRSNIRQRGQGKGDREEKTEFVHTLNGTAIAISRTLLALIENFQTKDGKVELPKCLKPFLGA